ncbi:DUF1839 family protein [Beijerinckia sp. L45]|uniref:DUF1839 family protein n=1 Tax=Beijerinckia sp. L45 TaxID=1641855 RepID=UPI0034CE2248
MLAKAPIAVFPSIKPEGYAAHALHDGARDWPETNCYIDVWIEVLHALGADPTAAMGFAVAQDFEGDHFTFAKIPLEDLFDLYGLEVTELALYDTLETHVLEQTARGRMVIVEVDSFYLPDTRGVSYQLEHTKTTIAINRVNADARELDYFHGAGFFTLRDDDYDAVLPKGAATALFPYAEFVKFDRRRSSPDASKALTVLRRHVARRPTDNPVLALRDRLRDQVIAASEKPSDFLHKYAFNTARQLGMNFELLGSHLAWLAAHDASLALAPAIEGCQTLSSGAKSFQFQLARAVARKRFDTIEANLDPLAASYERIVGCLAIL